MTCEHRYIKPHLKLCDGKVISGVIRCADCEELVPGYELEVVDNTISIIHELDPTIDRAVRTKILASFGLSL